MSVYCTLFDSSYLSRGIAMYESLKHHCEDFHLYILAFDDICFNVLSKMNLSRVTLISLDEFEDEELLKVKPTRSKGEYCWTCTSSLILHVIKKHNVSICTYLDSDIYFFSSPAAILRELMDDSVIITEHRYTPEYDRTETSGKYCVQFMTFRNDEPGLKVLNWWREACIVSCELNEAEGKCGDQKYLDEWPSRFPGVHELVHLGGGVAPWNVQQYAIFSKDGKLHGIQADTRKEFEVIFYHFQNFRFYNNDSVYLCGYRIPPAAIDLIYKPYYRHLERIKDKIAEIDNSFDPHGTVPPPFGLIGKGLIFIKKHAKRFIKSLPLQDDNIYYRTEFME